MFKAAAVIAVATLSLAGSSATAQAQTESPFKPDWQFIISSGTVIPTGAQRDAIKRSPLTTAQVSYVLHPAFAITGSVGWARTRDIASVDNPKLDMFTYDLGGEVRADRWLAGKTVSLSPFAGLGAGGRSYNYRNLDIDATHNFAAYANTGAEIGVGSRVKLRLEARDYITGFKPLSGGGAVDTRNDLSLMAGLRVKVR